MKANERAKERGCELPLTLIGKIHGVSRQKLNEVFNGDRAKFDRMIDKATRQWKSICK